ncbi:global transactivator [Fusarium subglutinans]|uniref:Global transactivator n=1 Tax=Gibberella subglutinans TaxID=42677 RepID=A0A8H5PF69_GIBSU|nr:global transactivator [Fusarium subglutinans]KAF5595721.1 global transactivator [Fusarium subglutinans]
MHTETGSELVAKAMKAADQLGISTIPSTAATNALSAIGAKALEAIKEVANARENDGDDTVVTSSRKGLNGAARRILLAEYNGTVNLEERSRVQFAFNLSIAGPDILPLIAGAGGQGLNLARGTHMIITESSWTPRKLDQVIGRTYRLPQDKTVHIWHMIAHPSKIDMFVLDRQAQKVHFVRQLLSAFTGEADTKASDEAVDINKKALPTRTIHQWAKGRAKDVAENERINKSSRWRSRVKLDEL